ncbi:PLP-dependent transferase [Apiospora arundinis]|uniref:PLP-dependent transferase n=1 Tax=Apiospora arundinis TaxID=335852 RepID=A0ABR2HSJ4_9PEZI
MEPMVEPTEIEKWMRHSEDNPGVLNLAHSHCSSISLDGLVQFDTRRPQDNRKQRESSHSNPLDLGAILAGNTHRTSRELRNRIAELYGRGPKRQVRTENVIVTSGGEQAIDLIFNKLIQPSDHVISMIPNSEHLRNKPKHMGCKFTRWMIVISNPIIPTGVMIPKDVLKAIVEVARHHDAILVSYEAWRPLFLTQPRPPSVATLDWIKTIAISSVSEVWGLTGIQIGWIASPDRECIEWLADRYSSNHVSRLDVQVALYAMHPSVRPHLLSRSIDLAKCNLELLSQFVNVHHQVSWVKPTAGTTAYLQFREKGSHEPVDDQDFCQSLLRNDNVLLMPGSLDGWTYQSRGYVRINYVCNTKKLKRALKLLSQYLKER